MKIRLNILSGLLFLFLFVSCEKEEVLSYKENPGVNFNTFAWTQQLMKESISDTIRLPLAISGSVKEYDRKVRIEAVLDTNTTATPEMYVLLEGIVKAGEYYGNIPVILYNDPILRDSILTVKVKLLPTNDFPEVRLGGSTCTISFTTKVVKPVNWRWLQYQFGAQFSTRWWNFIQEATGLSTIPYDPVLINSDPETWWVTNAQMAAYKQLVKIALYNYNNDPANGGPLTHDDGPNAGEEVKMP